MFSEKKESLLNPTLFNKYLKCKYYIVNEISAVLKKNYQKAHYLYLEKAINRKNYFKILKKNTKILLKLEEKEAKLIN